MNNQSSFDQESDFIAVKKEEFITGSHIPTDIYLKLSDQKYICVARKGSKTALDQLHVAGQESVREFYVLQKDYEDLVQANIIITGKLLGLSQLPSHKKMALLNMTMESVFRELDQMGLNESMLSHARLSSQHLIKYVQDNPGVSSLVDMVSSLGTNFLKETVLTTTISIVLAKATGWPEPRIQTLALAAMLHDVGLKEIPLDIISKRRIDMTAEERVIWEGHCFKGAELIRQQSKTIPLEVITVALEHHENAWGQGFPRKLNDVKMSPCSRIVALADCLSDLVTGFSNGGNGEDLREAVSYIEYGLGAPFNKAVFWALKEACLNADKLKRRA